MFSQIKPQIDSLTQESIANNTYLLKLKTNRGIVQCRYYLGNREDWGAIWVGGVGGSQSGWNSPAKGLYPRLCQELTQSRITSLWIRYRYEHQLLESVFDVLTGIQYLKNKGICKIALIGHSFGGAVVIHSAVSSDLVRTVITLATQRANTDCVSQLPPHCSILLLHGKADKVLLPWSSEKVYQLASYPKQLLLYDGADHDLDEVSDKVYLTVKDWLMKQSQA